MQPPRDNEASAPTAHWSAVAQRWELVGSPLRPSATDCEVYAAAVRSWHVQDRAPRALILGVTPELYRLPWPNGSSVTAIDHTQAMIDALWPGPQGTALNAEWTGIPLPAGSIDVALCDGGFHLLSHPEQQMSMVRSLASVLTPAGLFIVRLFVPPKHQETAEHVLDELDVGAIPNLNVLKLRLGMALQPSAQEGVELHSVWTALHSRFPDLTALAQHLNWDLAHLQAIDTYRNCASRYHFVSADTVQRMFCSVEGGFDLVSVHTCAYELGERCPLLVFRRRDAVRS